MKRVKAIIATTHVDAHGDKLMLSALESMLDSLSRQTVPVQVEHDPRRPPIGKIVSGNIVELEDSEFGLEVESEIFEPSDQLPPLQSDRELPIHEYVEGRLQVVYDRSFQTGTRRELVERISQVLGSPSKEYVKKAIEPLSILIISGAVVALGQISSGFLGRLGEDAYEKLKSLLKQVFVKEQPATAETLLQLQFLAESEGTEVEVWIIATDPSAHDIDGLLGTGLETLDRALLEIVDPTVGLRRVVFEYGRDGVLLRYAIRRDGYPMLWQPPVDPDCEDDA